MGKNSALRKKEIETEPRKGKGNITAPKTPTKTTQDHRQEGRSGAPIFSRVKGGPEL